jgi:hypothetical protein
VREDIVRDHDRTRLEAVPDELVQPLVVLLLGVDEDDVEVIGDVAEQLACVALDQRRRFVETASARLRRQASQRTGSTSSETTLPPSSLTPAASQIVE